MIVKNGMFFCISNDTEDKEWDDACNADETTKYYKCEMLNHGWCFKCYKPSVAKLVMKRGAYLQMIEQ